MLKSAKLANINHVDIMQREITYFLMLADTQNISKASEVLGVQQSGLSRALKRLEDELGQKLFQRKNNGLILTAAGEQFLRAVKMTMRTWDDAFKMVTEDPENPTGPIKIGLNPSFGQKYFPAIVKRLNEQYPQLEIEARTFSSAQITRKVNEQEFDFGLVISDLKNPEIIRKKVGSDYIASYQKNTSTVPTTLLFNPEMRLSASILKKHNKLNKVFIQDYEMIASTCLITNSVAILPKSVAEKYPSLTQTSGPYLKADICWIAHKEKLLSKSARNIFETVAKVCSEI